MYKRLYPKGDHPDIANSMNNVANTLGVLGKHQEALKMHRDALAMRKRLYPDSEHPDIANSMNNVAVTLQYLGKHQEALKMYKDAIDVYNRSLPPDHPNLTACRKAAISC